MSRVFLKKDFPVEWIRAGDISVVWVSAQRPLNDRKVSAIEEGFDPYLFGFPVVCKPNGHNHYHAVDGQHRITALRQLYGDDEMVPCLVVPANSPADAARIFLGHNGRNRSKPTALEMFRVAVTAKEDEAVAVNGVVKSAGYTIGVDITCVATLVRIYRRYGPVCLREALTVVSHTWGDNVDATHSAVVEGVASILHDYSGQVDTKMFTKKISKAYTPGRLLGAGRASREMFKGTLATNIAKILVESYNNGLRVNRLVAA